MIYERYVSTHSAPPQKGLVKRERQLQPSTSKPAPTLYQWIVNRAIGNSYSAKLKRAVVVHEISQILCPEGSFNVQWATPLDAGLPPSIYSIHPPPSSPGTSVILDVQKTQHQINRSNQGQPFNAWTETL